MATADIPEGIGPDAESRRLEAQQFKARLQRLAALVGSVNALAKASGIAQSTIRNYFEKGEPPRSVLLALARAANVRVEWLMAGSGHMQISGAHESDEFIYIPLYDARASAGRGTLADAEAIEGLTAFKRSWLRARLAANPAHLSLLYAEGDSMEPTLRAGDMILVDRGDADRPRDGIYVLRMDGSLFVKRLQYLAGADAVKVVSDNPLYEPRKVPLSALGNEVKPIGRVVWFSRWL